MAKDIADYGIQHLQFNQDSSCFIVSTSYGFRVFALQDDEGPAKQQLNRRFEQGGIGFGEMLFRYERAEQLPELYGHDPGYLLIGATMSVSLVGVKHHAFQQTE
eukprot:TRINITY_DN11394_c0_g1_i11.p4 TRINITY_DN11394_c0_g1~~TRINITY_DN11394_c0_g1_i11.p4  ORF type:complete len:104 (+),score=8.53 TRINITY_DN11394_c0_g1_i11:124-435(+)